MSDPFTAAVTFVLTQEGLGSDDPRDPGGLTRYGFSQRSHPDLDVGMLTQEQAVTEYRYRYWRLCQCENLPPALAMALFDAAVQHGPTQAIRLLQEALGVVRDGILGPQTLGAAQVLPWGNVLVRFLAFRIRLYASLPHQAVFGLGWARRCFALQQCIYDHMLNGGMS